MSERVRPAPLPADIQRRLGRRWPHARATATNSEAQRASATISAGAARSASQRLLTVWTHGGEFVALVVVALVAYWGATRAIFLPTPHTPRNAIPIIVALNIGAALLVPYLRQRLHLNALAIRGLPDPLYTLYLATLILVGARAAVALAIVTPFASDAPYALWSLLRHRRQRRPSLRLAFRSFMRLLRQAAASAVIIWLAGLSYIAITIALHALGLSLLNARIPAALAAAGLTLLCICALRLGRQAYDIQQMTIAGGSVWASRARLWSLCRVYLDSPMFRYQALLLCACPLLPLVEAIDDVVAELAWALFLAPLCAVYYLALLSVRLQQRTDELQLTVEELGASRQREAELQDYAALITQAQEDERRRLARELHDYTAQALVALARGLDSLNGPSAQLATTLAEPANYVANHVASQEEPKRATEPTHPGNAASDARFIAELGAMARQALENVRRACRDLRPSVLDDLGLAAALDALSADMNRRGLPCAFYTTGAERAYPSTVEVTIYRIAQEALSNTLHHAQPAQARLELTYEPDAIRLVVADNGRGFDYAAQLRKARLARDRTTDTSEDTSDPLGDDPTPKAANVPTSSAETRVGLGLLGMRERAALIGATLDIQSVRGLGVRLTLVARANPQDPHLPL